MPSENVVDQQRHEPEMPPERAFRRRVVRGVGITAVICILLAYLLWLVVHRSSATVIVPDCTKPWAYTYTGAFLQMESLRIHIRGHVAGRAAIRVSTSPRHIEQAHPEVIIGPGNVDYTYPALEWWSRSCSLLYTPDGVASGQLEVTIVLE
jgi:hypothetical protein